MDINGFLSKDVVNFLKSENSRLLPVLAPLRGKYYGTIIQIGDSEIKINLANTDFENELCRIPSDRELLNSNITLDQWKNNEFVDSEIGSLRAKDILEMNNHVEDQLSYLVARTFIETFDKISALHRLYNFD